MMEEKNFNLKDIEKSPVYMVARIKENGDAESVIHATDETTDAASKLLILFSMLLKDVARKVGFDVEAITDVAIKFIHDKLGKEDD